MWKRNCTARFLAVAGALGLGGCANLVDETPTPETRQVRIAEMIAEYRALFPEVEGLDAAAVAEALETGSAVIVDVRPEPERRVSMIPGAIALEEFEARADELAGSRVITYCTIGHRSSDTASELSAKGWDAANFDGSLLAWTHAGGELIDSEGRPTRRLHVFGRRWDLVADGYEAVW